MKKTYTQKVIPALKEKFGHSNSFAVPKIERITLNAGVGRIVNNFNKGTVVKGAAVSDKKGEESAVADIIEEMTLITGQKPQIIRAKKSIAGFKLRKGMIVGIRTTLRGERMYDFLSRLIKIAFPRTRDFRGIDEKSVDKHGNITIGIREQIIFPEIPHDKVRKMWGMEVVITSNAKTREEGLELLRVMGMPFKKA